MRPLHLKGKRVTNLCDIHVSVHYRWCWKGIFQNQGKELKWFCLNSWTSKKSFEKVHHPKTWTSSKIALVELAKLVGWTLWVMGQKG